MARNFYSLNIDLSACIEGDKLAFDVSNQCSVNEKYRSSGKYVTYSGNILNLIYKDYK